MKNDKRLSVIIVRPLLPSEDRATTRRALASLGGAASEVVFPTVAQAVEVDEVETTVAPPPYRLSEDFYMPDVPSTFYDVLPGPFSGAMIPKDLSALVNVMMADASCDYVLLLDPAEVCLDPTNVTRTLDFLDANPHIEAVSCQMKVYDGDEHVRTLMRPKIFRRGRVELAGVLADAFQPDEDTNYLLAASGLTFRDTNGAGAERRMLELKLLVARRFSEESPPCSLTTDVARRLCDCSPSKAVVILENLLRLQDRKVVLDLEVALPLRLLGRAHERTMTSAPAAAASAYDESLAIEGTAEGYLWRGLGRFRQELPGWQEDLRWGLAIGGTSSFYNLDLREVRAAQEALAADSYPDLPPCEA